MATSNIASVPPAAADKVHMSPAVNGDLSAAEEVTDAKGGAVEKILADPSETKVVSAGDDEKNRGSDGSAGDNSGASKPPARDTDIFFKMLAHARDIFSKVLTPARAAFALFTTLALWSAADRPERAVWTFSVIACCYLALWTIYLTAAIRARTVLVSVSYVALLAAAVTHLSSAAGILFMLLDTAYAAGLLGYALAEFRQRRGAEHAAEQVSAELEANRNGFTMFSFYSDIISLACAAAAAWMVLRYAGDTYWLVVGLSLSIHLALFCWTCLVTLGMLRGALVDFDFMVFMYWLNMILFLPDFLLTYLFGNTIGMLVHPIGVMALAGLLGYSLGVHARYKDMKNTLEGKKNE